MNKGECIMIFEEFNLIYNQLAKMKKQIGYIVLIKFRLRKGRNF